MLGCFERFIDAVGSVKGRGSDGSRERLEKYGIEKRTRLRLELAERNIITAIVYPR